MKQQVEDEVRRRLRNISNNHKVIEKMSKLYIKYKIYDKEFVSFWVSEFVHVSPDQKLAFIHLVHDILQRCLDTTASYAKLFQPFMQKAFADTAKYNNRSIRKSLSHLLLVWAQREVFSRKTLRNLRAVCQKAVAENDGFNLSDAEKKELVAKSPFAFSFTMTLVEFEKNNNMGDENEHEATSPVFENQLDSPLESEKSAKSDHSSAKYRIIEDKPRANELIEALRVLDNPASTDGDTRKTIAQFNPEMSDPFLLKQMVENNPDSISIYNDQMDFISKYIEDYLGRLKEEEMNRRKAGKLLKTFKHLIDDEISSLQRTLHETNKQLHQTDLISKRIESHMASLPEFLNEPDVEIQQNLAPLPNLNDLFR